MKESIVMVIGPTASGKSSLALQLCERFDAEILSVDSVQIYRGLDIGTAKPTAEERARVPHHLIDLFEPDEQCNLARFIELADEAIDDITSRGKRVIAVGGTNLYVRGLRFGVFDAPPPNPAIRAQHKSVVDAEGAHALHDMLVEVDADFAARIHPNDTVRTSRALEVFELTGQTMTELQAEHGFKEEKYRALPIAVDRDRAVLYERINQRVDQMMEAGLLHEYRSLVERFDPELPSLNALGYRHMRHHVFDTMPLEEAVELLKRDTRRFAKQQLSWLRGEDDLLWCASGESAIAAVETFYT